MRRGAPAALDSTNARIPPGSPGGDRLSDGFDAGEDEVDAGKELLAVVMAGELRRQLTDERVLRGVELRPLSGDRPEER
jgi:hypothetical protein